MTAKSRGIIRLTETFPVSAERVFDAWLSPEKVAQWFLNAEERVTSVEIDARVGGSIRILTYRAGRAIERTGKYLEIRRPQRLSFTINGSAFAKTVRITVLIEPRGAGCSLTLISAVEPAPLRALTPLGALATYRPEKVARPRWPALEAKAVLSLAVHLAMLPLLPIILFEPELPPVPGALPPLATMTVDLGTGESAKVPEQSDLPAVVAPSKLATTAPPPPSAPAASVAILPSPAAADRPAPHAAAASANIFHVPPWRTTSSPKRTAHDQGTNDKPPGTRSGGMAGEGGEVRRQRTHAASAQVGPPPAGTICSGTITFSPDAGDGTYYGVGLGTYWGARQVPVQARFFRDDQGSPWIRLTLWSASPWNLPVTVSGSEIRWTGLNGSGYALRPAGNGHLIGVAGFSNDSAAKVDFTCAWLDAHPT